jgi:hypothetical protein
MNACVRGMQADVRVRRERGAAPYLAEDDRGNNDDDDALEGVEHR